MIATLQERAMSIERRIHPRLTGPFDGSWDGTSGMRTCRITDLSAGGCFIDAVAAPASGSTIAVLVNFEDESFLVPAAVVYVDRIQGFAVQFLPDEVTTRLGVAIRRRI
jgi:hypothetical protein